MQDSFGADDGSQIKNEFRRGWRKSMLNRHYDPISCRLIELLSLDRMIEIIDRREDNLPATDVAIPGHEISDNSIDIITITAKQNWPNIQFNGMNYAAVSNKTIIHKGLLPEATKEAMLGPARRLIDHSFLDAVVVIGHQTINDDVHFHLDGSYKRLHEIFDASLLPPL